MKWIAALLLILNVVIFLGVSDRQVATGAAPENDEPDVNPDSMLLVKEIAPNLKEQTTDDETLVDSIPDPIIEVQTESIIEPIDSVFIASEVSLICYRVGPFRDRANWQSAKQWVKQRSIIFDSIRSESRELRAVRVFLGPYESSEVAQGAVKLLKSKGLEHFFYRQDDDEYRISLGYFTQEELAIKFIAYLVKQGIQAKSYPEYRTLGPFDWMDIRISKENRHDLVSREWGAKTIQIAEQPCETL